MSGFTTRPELRGTFGMVASTHWIASSVGMAILERGGNAFDAAVAAGLTLQVVEPHLNGPAGEVPIVLYDARSDDVVVVNGQGPAPAAATVERFLDLGHELVPGTGVLAACVPGAFDAWMLLLRDFGTLGVDEVLAPAIAYADAGHPVLPRVAQAIAAMEPTFRAEWPTSAEVYLPVPAPWSSFRNEALAATYRRVVREAEAAGGGRQQRIEAASQAWYRGFVAEAIDAFVHAEGGLLAGEDLASFRATRENPVSLDFRGHTVFKCGPWSQGPVFLQQLALLDGFDLGQASDAEYVHTVVECAKLAFADRDAHYGDPAFVDVPLDRLMARAYADERRTLVSDEASGELRPGLDGRLPRVPQVQSLAGMGEPTRDRDLAGSAEQAVGSDPPLGTRAQMFWLEPEHPNALAPRKRPRTTLSPSLAFRGGRPYLAFGTPGGDQQDQWTLHVFLQHVLHGRDLQAAIDAPAFHTDHLVGSFYPRPFEPRSLALESRFGGDAVADLRRRGHDVTLEDPWSLGRVSAVGRDADGTLKAAANPRGMQGYAAGR